MNQIIFDNLFVKPKLFISALLVLSLSLFSISASAAQSDAPDTDGKTQTERSTRDFNHMTTGFPLTGLHTTVECGSCHVGGVFKGTPRNCAGCHTKGMRVVATAKSLKHLVTTEPCEVCHTNTVSFYGARFNHSKAVAGQCSSCHNGLIATGKPSDHSSGTKATNSCDKCHRTYAWSPATFNHTGVTEACANCHNGVTARGKHSAHISTTLGCDACHRQTTWLGATAHSGNEAGRCLECHIPQRPSNHNTSAYLVSCDACHTTSSWKFNHSAQQGKHTCYSCHSAKGINEHGSKASGEYYNCDNCHTVNSWDK